MTSSAAITDRARGTLLGLAVGDALGGPVEWLSADEIARKHDGRLTEMTGGGWLHLRPGQVTDDTEMALCLSRALVGAGDYDSEAALRQYVDWYRSGPADVGNTISSVLQAVDRGEDARQAAHRFHERSGGKSAGNGSLMRVAPLALRYHDDLFALAEAARSDSALTHYDALAAEACAAYTTLLATAISGHELLEIPVQAERVLAALNADRRDVARRVGEQVGFVLTALAVGVCAWRTAVSFEEGLAWAVNLGGDADTNGAVAGALLGAREGMAAIPERWLEPLEGRRELLELADLLAGLR